MKYSKKKKEKIKILASWTAVIGLLVTGSFAIWVLTLKIPDLGSFEGRKVTESTKIYDRTGEVLLFDIYSDVKRTVVPFEEISDSVKKATIAIEDAEFYEHKGVKPTAVLRAILVNIGSLSYRQGGSTITQQAVKNSLLTSEKRISRKIKEWVLAVKIEKILTKDEILALYLNEIPYGGNIYGIEEASNSYFGKSAKDLTVAESAYLAALPKAPSFYSPYRNKEDLEERKNLVLREMVKNEFLTEEDYQKALAEKVEFRPREDQGIKAPHFVMFVKDLLVEKYGQEVLENGGLKVITSLDYELQKEAEELAKKFALDNKQRFNAENIAVVAIDPKTGDILAMVGSRDYFDEEIDGNFNVATASRQPGSAFKPFAYAAAFNKGYTPETTVFDLPTVFTSGCTPDGRGTNCYMPQNYDNIFRGPISFRNALAQSVNVPSVKVLYLAGLDNTLKLAKAMGVQGLSGALRYGLTLVLGGGEVSLLDMTSAYGVFANNGVRLPYRPILEIRDKKDTVLEKTNVIPRQVLPTETAWKISDILSDDAARAPAFGANSLLSVPGREVAVKTGTTNDYKDAWIIGYTPHLVVGAWAGNNDNRPMEKKVAGFIIAPFWNAFITKALAGTPNTSFARIGLSEEESRTLPAMLRGIWRGSETYVIDRISGKLATDLTPPETRETVSIGAVRTILYSVQKDNPRGPRPENPERDPQFLLWDAPIREWVNRQGIVEYDKNILPTDFDNVHIPENFPKVRIISPIPGNTYSFDQPVRIEMEAQSVYPITKTEFYLNGTILGGTPNFPGSFSFLPGEISEIVKDGGNQLSIVVEDSVFNETKIETVLDIRKI